MASSMTRVKHSNSRWCSLLSGALHLAARDFFGALSTEIFKENTLTEPLSNELLGASARVSGAFQRGTHKVPNPSKNSGDPPPEYPLVSLKKIESM